MGEGTVKERIAKKAPKTDIIKFAGLIAFLVVIALVIAVIWPYISMAFEEGGLEKIVAEMDDAGFGGVLLLEALQLLQIIVAFIPGEVVQLAAGAIYGPWIGGLIILVGCIISSAIVFLLVRKLGAPFVHDMVPKKYILKLEEFEHSKKFNLIVFILFLIPGLPKDLFTYVVPLTDMRFREFMLVTNIARIPGIILSTYAANGLINGDIWQSVAIFLALAIVSGVALIVFNRITDKVSTKVTKYKEEHRAH